MEKLATQPRARVLTGAVLRAAELMHLNNNDLARLLGLSPSTITRMHQGKYAIAQDTKAWELATLLVRLFRGLDAIMAGDNTALLSWMDNPNTHLHAVPKDLILGTEGLVRTLAYVDSSRARI